MENNYNISTDAKEALDNFAKHLTQISREGDFEILLEEWLDANYKSTVVEEKTIPVTLAMIKAKCGWNEFCDVTGGNHYALKEFSIDDREIFDVKESHARELNLI